MMIGQTLGRYRIESKPGEGGMGVVYKARDTHLDRPVAIKVLPPERVADAERKRRFVQEAKSASALNDPNILHIYDIGNADGLDFMAMEYVEGKTLDELLRAKPLKLNETLRYATQIASALAAAHATGIIHRDIKPSNIMVNEKGIVKVLDFGLAKLIDTGKEDGSQTQTLLPRTEEGTIVGTVAYMSPEQAEGRKLDTRSDIFSFGSVLYEMVTGRRPFTGESTLSILTRILSEDPKPPSRVGPPVPPELERIILRCLRKDPARRYQTMADLKVALNDVAEELGASKQLAGSPFRRRSVWAALLPLLAVGSYIAWRASRATESTEPLRAFPLTTQPGVHRYPSFSPDGNHVAFAWNGPKLDNQDIYVQQIGTGNALRLTTDPGNDYNPVWSPDGRSIAFLRRPSEGGTSELRTIPPLGGTERKLTEVRIGEVFVTAPYLTWCPDSDCLVITDSPGEGKPLALFVVFPDSLERRQLTYPQPPAAGDSHPTVSPDGRWLVFRRNPSGIFAGELYRLPLKKGLIAAGEPKRLTPATLGAEYPVWIPDSKEILFSAKGNLWRLNVLSEGTPAQLPFVGEDGIMPVVSRTQSGQPSGMVFVRSFVDLNIWRVETSAPGASASSPPAVAIASTRREGMPQLSPDGRRLAFFADRKAPGEIWVADLDGSNAIQIAAMDAGATGYPHWSPDGRLIAFHSNRGGQGDVYVVPAAGGKPQNLTSHAARDSFPSFSRDGKWIYFSSNRSGEDRTWKIPVSGGDAVPVTNTVGYMPCESPDGTWLYYVQNVFTPGPLLRVPVSGGVPEKVLDAVVLGNFVVLERGIYYIDRPSGQGGIYWVDRPSGETRLQYFDFATRKSTTVVRNLGNVDTPLTASADGRTIFYSRVDSSIDDLMLVENFR